jgi:hypothetical protein
MSALGSHVLGPFSAGTSDTGGRTRTGVFGGVAGTLAFMSLRREGGLGRKPWATSGGLRDVRGCMDQANLPRQRSEGKGRLSWP